MSRIGAPTTSGPRRGRLRAVENGRLTRRRAHDAVTPAGCCGLARQRPRSGHRRIRLSAAPSRPESRGERPSAPLRASWLVRPVERADARRSRNGGAAIPRVVFRPRDPCRHKTAMSGRERLTTVVARLTPTRRGSGRVRAEAPFPASGIGPGQPACPERRRRASPRRLTARAAMTREAIRGTGRSSRSIRRDDERARPS